MLCKVNFIFWPQWLPFVLSWMVSGLHIWKLGLTSELLASLCVCVCTCVCCASHSRVWFRAFWHCLSPALGQRGNRPSRELQASTHFFQSLGPSFVRPRSSLPGHHPVGGTFSLPLKAICFSNSSHQWFEILLICPSYYCFKIEKAVLFFHLFCAEWYTYVFKVLIP